MTVMDWALPDSVGNNIRAEMARRRKKQAELALLLGLAQSGVSERLNGHVEFKPSQLATIAAWLDVPLAVLLPDPRSGSTRQYLSDTAALTLAA